MSQGLECRLEDIDLQSIRGFGKLICEFEKRLLDAVSGRYEDLRVDSWTRETILGLGCELSQ